MYAITITAITTRNEIDNRVNPKISPNGVKGRITVRITTARVAVNRYFEGLLLKKGFRLRITSTIKEAEITDSKNQPVLN